MSQSVEQLPSVAGDQILEVDVNKANPKICSKLVLSEHIIPDSNATQLTFNLDLSKLNKRSREVKLTKVTHGLGAINISPRSKAALIQIKPVVPIIEKEDIDNDVDDDVGTPLGSGKRVASTALATTSDEDSDSGSEIAVESNIEHDYAHRTQPDEQSLRDSHDQDCTGNDSGIGGSVCDSVELSDREHSDLNVSWSPVSDHDYENVSSPGNSSTASGPIYTRQPGFAQHAHEVSRPKTKKKKTVVPLWQTEGAITNEPTPPTRSKPKRGPVPMRQRALPQSFWIQPNVTNHAPPSNTYQLPPLDREPNIEDIRPITPPAEDRDTKERPSRTPRTSFRTVSTADTDLLFKLFDSVEKKHNKKPDAFQLKRGGPRKVVPCPNKQFVKGEDPYLNDSVTDNIFPQLGERSRIGTHQQGGNNPSLQIITLREGDKSVSLPALSVEQNFPQMLSELVMHI